MGMTEDEMVGGHHWLDRHEFEQALGYGQGSLVCCRTWGRKESDTTENWTEYGSSELGSTGHLCTSFLPRSLALRGYRPEHRLSIGLHACSVSQLCPSLRPYGLQPARLLYPWDFPGKNTCVGCHFLLHFHRQEASKRELELPPVLLPSSWSENPMRRPKSVKEWGRLLRRQEST